ncbi:hypothetical protein GCM10010430_60240 [Kitasatospora cystarginea]|uniref:DUF317 domain-containing protein n=1 Tax=Kitasatospora cystarginea TaxID=58350 RepID=A0ABP5RPM0_9ACTN
MPATAPTRPDVLVRPAHLTGPGGIDLPSRLASEHGWFRPFDAPPGLVLISPQERLALNRQHQQWNLTGAGGWTVRFCDRVPGELPYALISAAQDAEDAPAAATAPITGHRATVMLLESGWSGFNRDGYRLVSAPDRRAALSWPESAPDPGPALTAATQRGVWTVQFSRNAPDHLLTAATGALLRAVSREPEQIRGLVPTATRKADRGGNGPAGRSAAARTRGGASHPALGHLPPPALPPLTTHYSPAGPARRQPDPR